MFSTHKPLLRNSTVFDDGTFVDYEFKHVEAIPLIDDIEYNLDLDCKLPIPANVTIPVTYLNAEEQMCMYEMEGVPVDMFNLLRQLTSTSIPLDVKWFDDKTLHVSSEYISMLENVLPDTSLNMTRISENNDCIPL